MPFNKMRFIQSATVILVGLILLVAGYYGWRKYQWAQEQLVQVGPRYARMQGVQGLGSDLEAIRKSTLDNLGKGVYFADTEVSKAGNDAQQRIKAAFEASQLSVISLQVLEPKEEERFQRIRITLLAEGPLQNIQDALLRIRDQNPVVLVDSFSIQTTGYVRPASIQVLTANFEFQVLRLKS